MFEDTRTNRLLLKLNYVEKKVLKSDDDCLKRLQLLNASIGVNHVERLIIYV